MEDKKSVKIAIFFTAAFFIFMIVFFSAWKSALNQKKSAETEKKTKITATFYPVYVILLNLTEGADDVSVELLAPPSTGCLHDYQLTTGDMKKIQDCEILVANGSGMEDFLEKAMIQKKNALISATDGFPSAEKNPHVWTGISGAVYETQKIAEGLCRLDEKNAAVYEKNAEIYVEKLESLRKKMQTELAPYRNAKIVVFHDSFFYFAAEFGFEILAEPDSDEDSPLSARELQKILEKIQSAQKNGDRIFLFDEIHSASANAKIVSQETSLKLFTLDSSSAGILQKNAYIDAMEKNLSALKSAFSGR